MTKQRSQWSVAVVAVLAIVVLLALVGPWLIRPRGAGVDLEAGGRFGVGLISVLTYPVAIGAAMVLGVLAGDVSVRRSRLALLGTPLMMLLYGGAIGLAISLWWLGDVDRSTVQLAVTLSTGPFVLGYVFGAAAGWMALRKRR